MISLINYLGYLVEEIVVNPESTLGVSDPTLPTETTPGSGDQLSFNLIKKVRSNKKHSKSKKIREIRK